MKGLAKKFFLLGAEIVKTSIEISVEESRKEVISNWIDAFNKDIQDAADKTSVPVTAINRFQVTKLPEEVTKYLGVIGYHLELVGEGSKAQYYLLRK